MGMKNLVVDLVALIVFLVVANPAITGIDLTSGWDWGCSPCFSFTCCFMRIG